MLVQMISGVGFNPRPRMGGDFLIPFGQGFVSMFQSTPPHGGRPIYLLDRKMEVVFQSTPPHGGRRVNAWSHGGREDVSIHAPAWGAT